MDTFEPLLRACSEPHKTDVVDACDSAFLARAWLRDMMPEKHTSADVIALAGLIVRVKIARLQREHSAEQHEKEREFTLE